MVFIKGGLKSNTQLLCIHLPPFINTRTVKLHTNYSYLLISLKKSSSVKSLAVQIFSNVYSVIL